MPDMSPNQPPAHEERIISPQTLANLFNTAATEMLAQHTAQRLGGFIAPYDVEARIKQSRPKDRVTYVRLTDTLATAQRITTHEVYLPSRDPRNGDFEAVSAVFEIHSYDEQGSRTGTERTVLKQIDTSGPELRPYLGRLSALKELI